MIQKLILSIKEYSGFAMESNWPENEKWKGNDFETVVIIRCEREKKIMTVNRIRGAIRIPETQQGKDELVKWFFSSFIQ